MRSLVKSTVLTAAAAAASFAIASPAAASVTVAGGSQGCFGAACVVGNTATDNGLTYTGGSATFSQNTDATGFAAIGGPLNNFGTITLVPNGHVYTGDLFSLLITFTLPAGSGTGSFTANLLGSLTSTGTGGVQINFVNHDIQVSPGNLFLHVNDVSFSGSGALTAQTVLSQDINGYVIAVPEPASWALMLLGFGAVGLTMRSRRRKTVLAQVA